MDVLSGNQTWLAGNSEENMALAFAAKIIELNG